MRKSIFWLFGVFLLLMGATQKAHAFGGRGSPKVTLTSVKTTFGDPNFYGTGCNNDTATFLVSPDGEEISISYDEMVVEAGEGTNRTKHVKNCRAIIPVTAPQGMQLIIATGDFRGAATIPQDVGAFGRLSTKMSLQDYKRINSGSITNRNFLKGFDDSFEENRDDVTKPGWILTTGCGGSMNLIIDQEITVYTGNHKEYSTVALDTMDAGSVGGKVLKVTKKKC